MSPSARIFWSSRIIAVRSTERYRDFKRPTLFLCGNCFKIQYQLLPKRPLTEHVDALGQFARFLRGK